MSRRKKKGHSPKTQPWWGKTSSENAIAQKVERAILGSMRRAADAEERRQREAEDAQWSEWMKLHPPEQKAAPIPREAEYGPLSRSWSRWAR